MYLALKNRSGKLLACMILLWPPSLLQWTNFMKTCISQKLSKNSPFHVWLDKSHGISHALLGQVCRMQRPQVFST